MRTLLLLLSCALVVSSCTVYPATQAGTVSRKGGGTVPRHTKENRHF